MNLEEARVEEHKHVASESGGNGLMTRVEGSGLL